MKTEPFLNSLDVLIMSIEVSIK
ncbi:CLUMA_CG021021, isoform A [Clunio marinus]|uniref:CLUMA_CG021021, isoform A n=1 Tax=Clunio marinus TaxID=568069 RepID=A0A1J1J8R9_9DIPT|nr:CLUMA_CG021021, isoform A [Clunio marinus]